ncbi:Bug family tripartite tricarboxylate transporter substrate binding protein [Cupriavidus necator]|uniref:Bug family tripartite tricarboxylate transporter substrate binding protein n=1 Tax=Cupriavidus necator TaxID=106590 RepID=UPI0008A8A3B6|nr:Bug family tripartite tricarboxylate transporter substrate binding protein [Cupriavidus necator]
MKPFIASLARCLVVLPMALAAQTGMAQEGPVRILVGFPPGGVTDVVARLLAKGMQAEIARPVIVENRPGAGGQIAAQVLKSARPDGNTLFLTNSHTTAMIPFTNLHPGFDPQKDFVPVGLVGTMPNFFVVNPEMVGPEVDSLKAFSQWARAKAGRGNVGVPAPASAPEFSISLLNKAFGADLKAVAYKGDAPMVQDLLAGQIPAGICAMAAALPHVRAGKLKLLAVDGPERLPGFDVPTYAERGVSGLSDAMTIGIVAPAGIAPALVTKYNTAINKVVGSRAFQDRVAESGIIASTGTPDDMARVTEGSRKANAQLVKAAGYQPQ